MIVRVLSAAAGAVGGLLARLPGVAAAVCAVAGVVLLAGLAWALITTAAFLLLIDFRRRGVSGA